MRVLKIILSVYIFGLTLIPCGDIHSLNFKEKTSLILNETHQDDEEHDCNCTPFCSCSCCHTNISNEFNPVISDIQTDGFCCYIPSEIFRKPQFVELIWQPPK